MKKGLTELVMILDRSGSMAGLESDTIGGFNSMIEKQKKEDGEAYVSVVLFDDRSDVIYDRVPVEKVEPMTDRQYYVRGCTALLDAVGSAIHHIGNVHKYAREEDVPEKTIIREDGWKGFRITGVLDFSLIGILSKISGILAENRIGIFAVSTYNTDYVFVKEENFEKALSALEKGGFSVTAALNG